MGGGGAADERDAVGSLSYSRVVQTSQLVLARSTVQVVIIIFHSLHLPINTAQQYQWWQGRLPLVTSFRYDYDYAPFSLRWS